MHREGGGGREPAAAHEAVGAQQGRGKAQWAPGVAANSGHRVVGAGAEHPAGRRPQEVQGQAAPQPKTGRHGPGGCSGRKQASERAHPSAGIKAAAAAAARTRRVVADAG